ncbi:hypothetical protein BMS3Bbin09_00974 [bacterium BMS3Bbin09]|nr:hypothetical protein BMS3Bbin09_00974 [bacterium BMS3Bbin09]
MPLKSDLFELIFILVLAVFPLFFSLDTVSAQPYEFRDSENCMLCHRYPTIGRFDEAGEKKIFYIDGKDYASSVHGKLNCTDCHRGLNRIPHFDLRKVDCSVKCHLHNLSTKKAFSHMEVVGKLEASVHGKGPKFELKPFPEDLPDCTYCHDNRDYYSTGRAIGRSDDQAHAATLLRSQRDVIRLCASCHEDEEKMTRHGLESIKTFKDTFHWQAIKYGVKNAPDCISCHVPTGFSSHTIRPESDLLSPLNIKNRLQTCSFGVGALTCHPDATHAFAEGRVHEYGTKAQLLTGGVNMEGRFRSLMTEQARADIAKEDLFHYRVLSAIRLIYKILIGCTIGFMFFHQLLDYRRATKKGKTFH